MRGHYAVRRTSEIGVERQCTCCRGFWPEDDEFFTRAVAGGRFRSQCKACRSDHREAARKPKQPTRIAA